VTSTFAGGVWTASGAKADVNALLAGVTFNPAADFNGNFTIATSVSDGIAPAVTGTKAVTGIAVDDGDPNDFDHINNDIISGTGTGGDDTIYGSAGVDNIDGNNGNDTIYGRAGNDTLNGNNGNDVIYGGSGDDTISGNNGDDDLYGGSGNDTIIGGGDVDEIIGGYGADTLTAQGGNDVFRYWSVQDAGDTITDFGTGITDNDRFEFRLPWSADGFTGGFQMANQGSAGSATMNTLVVTGAGTSTGTMLNADVINFTAATKAFADSAAEIDALLDNSATSFNGGVLVVAYDASGNVALYYDADANDLGGVTQLVTLGGIGSTSTLVAADFSFIG